MGIEIDKKTGRLTFPKDSRGVILTCSKTLITAYRKDFEDLLRDSFVPTAPEDFEKEFQLFIDNLLVPISKFGSLMEMNSSKARILIMTYNDLKRNLDKPPTPKKDQAESGSTDTLELVGADSGQSEVKGRKGKLLGKTKSADYTFEGTFKVEFKDVWYKTKADSEHMEIETNPLAYCGIHIVEKFLKKCKNAVIVVDESHHGKNAHSDMEYKASETGRALLILHNLLPNAKFVYSTATMATYAYHFGNMSRLGLWGKNRFHQSFQEFASSFKFWYTKVFHLFNSVVLS